MKATVLENGFLKITVDEELQGFLQDAIHEEPDEFHSNNFMWDLFEGFIANSEYDWVRPEETGDLTSAPMLGIRGEGTDYEDGPILYRWAHMNYCITSIQEELAKYGEVILQGGEM